MGLSRYGWYSNSGLPGSNTYLRMVSNLKVKMLSCYDLIVSWEWLQPQYHQSFHNQCYGNGDSWQGRYGLPSRKSFSLQMLLTKAATFSEHPWEITSPAECFPAFVLNSTPEVEEPRQWFWKSLGLSYLMLNLARLIPIFSYSDRRSEWALDSSVGLSLLSKVKAGLVGKKAALQFRVGVERDRPK